MISKAEDVEELFENKKEGFCLKNISNLKVMVYFKTTVGKGNVERYSVEMVSQLYSGTHDIELTRKGDIFVSV